MPEEIEYRQKQLVGRELLTPVEVFRGAEFSVGTVTSAHVTSGLELKAVSSPVQIRPVNVEMYNQDAGWIEFEFRDGGLGGGRVLGPYKLNERSERRLQYDELLGRYFTSAVHVAFLSGFNATPLSTGIKINMSYVQIPTDMYGL